MSTKQLIIIKIGGSVITFKDSPHPKARINAIKRLTREIARSLKKIPLINLILVHGAGSYGHPIVKKYKLVQGMRNDKQKLGFSLTTQNMLRLNSLLVDSLINVEVPAVSIPPHSIAEQSNKKLVKLETGLIKKYLENGQVPVLFGDIVLDIKQGCSVLSGDVIVPYLAKKLAANKVIYLTDVDGVFDTDPDFSQKAHLIKEISDKNINKFLLMQSSIKKTKRIDVTGEMQGKLLAIKQYLPKVNIYIANGLKTGVLENLMLGKITRSTKLYFNQA